MESGVRGGSRGRVQGERTPPPPPSEMTCGFLIQLVFSEKKKKMWFIGAEVEQETSAPPPKKNPGSAPGSPSFTDKESGIQYLKMKDCP